MKDYSKNKVMTIIMWIVIVLITVGLIVAIIIGAVKAGKLDDSNDTNPPVETTDQDAPSTNDTDIPEIKPGTESGGEETDVPGKDEEAGNASVDILEQNKENEKDNQPHIVGDPSVLPGVKEVGNETND